MTDRDQRANFEEILHEAEEKFRKGVGAVADWGGQVRDLLEKQPGLVLAGVALCGFVSGLLIRRLAFEERRGGYGSERH